MIADQFGARWIAGPRRGLYANRNHIANACTGTHVLSADDDHEHPKDFIEKCQEALKEDPLAAWPIGEVLSWPELSEKWTVPAELQVWGGIYPPRDYSNSWAWSDGATLCPRRVFDYGLVFSEAFRFGAAYLEFACLLHYLGQRIRILETTVVIHHTQDSGRSFQIPVEERASSYFAALMMVLVYQPTMKNRILLVGYFLKELVRQPGTLFKAFPWALREKTKRIVWLRKWRLANEGKVLSL